MKLNIGNVILVHGWVMLDGLEDGEKYKVKNTPAYYGNLTYQFTKEKGKKVVARHYCNKVDPWIRSHNHPDLNRIEICQ